MAQHLWSVRVEHKDPETLYHRRTDTSLWILTSDHDATIAARKAYAFCRENVDQFGKPRIVKMHYRGTIDEPTKRRK